MLASALVSLGLNPQSFWMASMMPFTFGSVVLAGCGRVVLVALRVAFIIGDVDAAFRSEDVHGCVYIRLENGHPSDFSGYRNSAYSALM